MGFTINDILNKYYLHSSFLINFKTNTTTRILIAVLIEPLAIKSQNFIVDFKCFLPN